MDFAHHPDSHFRYLTRADVIEAARGLDIVTVVAEALTLHSAGQSLLPEEAYLGWTTFRGDSTRLPAMPGALVRDGLPPVVGMKTINASIGNPFGMSVLGVAVADKVLARAEAADLGSRLTL
ncbi:hypothetical protein [Streptomyces sp. NPDC056061]|uniref:hypothetical protein n=1 Tax=Streptomyces sp. NPDC056061 TaxID=3345700 RepID=UPI0035E380B1